MSRIYIFFKSLHLTNCWHHSSHEVKGSGEVPPGSDGVHAYARHVRLLVAPQEVVELLLAQVVLLPEDLEPLRPALLGLSLHGVLQRGEDGGSAQEVDDDEERQQQEPGVVLVDRSGAAATAAPTCHYVVLVTEVLPPAKEGPVASWSRRKTRIEKLLRKRATNEAAFSARLPGLHPSARSHPCSSPPAGILYLRCWDAQRSSVSRGATSGCSASCCGAVQPLQSSLLPCAPFTHRCPTRCPCATVLPPPHL